MAVVMQRRVKPLGYEYETTWGTDPATSRLAFMGIMRSAVLKVNEKKESYRGIGAGQVPQGFKWLDREVKLDLEYEVQDEKPTNSLLGLALGSDPNGATGVITNYPDGVNNNLRSFTVEAGYDWAGTDRYYQIKGCMIERLEMTLAESLILMKIGIIAKDFTTSTTPVATLPGLSPLRPFDSYADLTLTWANPVLSDAIYPRDCKVTIENAMSRSPIVGGGRVLGYMNIGGRKVYFETSLIKSIDDFETIAGVSPDLAGADIDVLVVASKNAGAEYISCALDNMQILGPYGFDYKDSDEEVKAPWRFEVKGYQFDVKS